MAHFSIFLVLIIGVVKFVRVEEAGRGLADEDAIVRSVNIFGGDLLHGLYANGGIAQDNILVSPVNVYATLTLLLLGSSGKTHDALMATMRIPEIVKNSTDLLRQLNAITSKITSRMDEDCFKSCVTRHQENEDLPTSKANDVENECREQCTFSDTRMANGLFVHNDFPIKGSYLELVKEFYSSQVKNVDFLKSQESTSIINEWISNNTNGRIPKFYENPLSSDTLAVLTSAFYFNARWKKQFLIGRTKNETFDTGSAQLQVPTMQQLGYVDYMRDDTLHYESVSIPYSGQKYVMTIYLQSSNATATDESRNISLADLLCAVTQRNSSTNSHTPRLVDLRLPKMKFSWTSSLVEALKLRPIFDDPNLEGMTSLQNLRVSDAFHATELEVDEKGTTATAASAVQIVLRSGSVYDESKAIKFHVNRPFLITIEHVSTRALLFAGIIRKPI